MYYTSTVSPGGASCLEHRSLLVFSQEFRTLGRRGRKEGRERGGEGGGGKGEEGRRREKMGKEGRGGEGRIGERQEEEGEGGEKRGRGEVEHGVIMQVCRQLEPYSLIEPSHQN